MALMVGPRWVSEGPRAPLAAHRFPPPVLTGSGSKGLSQPGGPGTPRVADRKVREGRQPAQQTHR